MAFNGFVGRDTEAQALKELLEREITKTNRLAIQSIEGPGGVGKSSVLWKALNQIDLRAHGYLTLQILGSSRDVKNSGGASSLAAIDQIIEQLISKAEGNTIGEKPPGYFFPQTTEATSAINQLRIEISNELKRKGISLDDKEQLKKTLQGCAGVTSQLAKIFPKINEYVNPEKLQDFAGELDNSAIQLESLQSGSIYFWEKLGIGSASTLREKAKKQPEELLSNALVSDLKAVILGDHKGNRLTPGHGKIKGLEKLLLVIEDYEALCPIINNLLVSHLIPQLRLSEIPATIIILGRFKLKATNPLWKDFFRETQKRLIIRPFTKEEVEQALKKVGVESLSEHERAWKETRGLPFYLSLWIDELEDGGRSATTLMEMHERVTMWMSSKQINWLHQMIFMEEIRVDTLELILSNHDEACDAYAWFETEGSILEQSSNPPKIIDFVQSRLQEYLKNKNLKKYMELKERVSACIGTTTGN